MWEDADVHIRLARDGARFHHEPTVLTWSLRRSESFSHDYLKSWRCRLAALAGYTAHSADASIARILASESEQAAAELFSLGDEAGARRGIALCQQVGGNPPTTPSFALRMLKTFLPAYSLFRWQCLRRHRANARTP
jgi:hypothetical protein